MFGIQSRPIPGRNWEYRFFFIDFEGNLNDSAVKNALRGIREEATNMKYLEITENTAAFAKKLLFLERLIKMFEYDELIVYREYEQEQDQVLNDMAFIVEETESDGRAVSDLRGLYFSCIHKLTELAGG